jgi:hypothetical protein
MLYPLGPGWRKGIAPAGSSTDIADLLPDMSRS